MCAAAVMTPLPSAGAVVTLRRWQAESRLSLPCQLQVPVRPAVADKQDEKAGSNEATMMALAQQLAGVPGKPTKHVAQVQEMAKAGDAAVELSFRKKTTFGRQMLASASLGIAELLQAQQEPVGVEVTSNGTPVAIVHLSATGTEPLGSEPFAGGMEQARIVPVTQAAYRR